MVSDRPLILAFDTAAAHCAAALVQGETVLARRDAPMARGQAEHLMPMLEEMLAAANLRWPALDALAVCTGPGNFTGLRLAVAAARGLALALGRPAIGVTLFEALAAPWSGPVLVTLEDRRDGLFAQRLRDGIPVGAAIAGDPARLGPFEASTRCLGFEASRIAERLGLVAGAEAIRADPVVLARVAAGRLDRPTPPAPLYLRPADAMPPSDPVPAILDGA